MSKKIEPTNTELLNHFGPLMKRQHVLTFLETNNIKHISDVPKCHCGQPVQLARKHYPQQILSRTCSPECSRSIKGVSEEVLELRSNKEWLYDQRVNKRIPNDEMRAILKFGGLDQLKQLYDKFGIPDIKYNMASPSTQVFLSDKEWLFEQHKVQNKTCKQIAEMIGSSQSSVSIALSNHEIEANEPNSYDRKINRSSKECMSVARWIRTWYDGPLLINRRRMFGGQEVDIFLEDFNFGIEYNGVFSHMYRPNETTPSKIKDASYHLNKTQLCEDRGYQLFHLWSSLWLNVNKRPIIESMIKSKCGKFDRRIQARKCKVVEISPSVKNAFLDSNHIQGRDKSTYKYGLECGGELVSVMTFTKSRYNKNVKWELTRFASSINVQVLGGFSKLLNHFRKNHDGSIISYADRLYSTGGVYKNNGFKLSHINAPSYFYVAKNSIELQHRFKFRKSMIASKEDEMSEHDIMYARGYHKIFDCGTLAYVLEK